MDDNLINWVFEKKNYSNSSVQREKNLVQKRYCQSTRTFENYEKYTLNVVCSQARKMTRSIWWTGGY